MKHVALIYLEQHKRKEFIRMKKIAKLFCLILPFLLFGCQKKPDTVTLTFEYCDYVIEGGSGKFQTNNLYYVTHYEFDYGHILSEEEVKTIDDKVSRIYPFDASISGYHAVTGYSLKLDKTTNDFVSGMKLTKDLHFYYHAF